MTAEVKTTTLTIALPKGRDTEAILELFRRADLQIPVDYGRSLVVVTPDASLRYLLAKPGDVPTYVEYGAADLGICGLDVLRECGADVYEPLLLGLGQCRLSLAGVAGHADIPLRYESQPRVATKYPRLAAAFFRARGVNAEIIQLAGSVELGPLSGLADLIVDLVETGDTLRANGLVELRTIMHSQEVLIANRAAYRLKSPAIQNLVQRLAAVCEQDAKRTESTNA